MNTLTASTLAALEEILQNSARSVPTEYIPIHLGIPTSDSQFQVIGQLHPDFGSHLKQILEMAPIPGAHMEHHRLLLQGSKPKELSHTMKQLAERMQRGGFIPGWRNEEFAYLDSKGHALFQLERAAFRTFGLKSMAIHVNGFTEDGRIWLGRRSENKSIDPGKLDNLCAGGIAAHETPWVCARRELWEEAGMPPAIADEIEPSGKIQIRRPNPPLGFHDEVLFIYDLEVPKHLVPSNHDGEVAGFIAISYGEAAARILADEFTNDAALVTADFILRCNKY